MSVEETKGRVYLVGAGPGALGFGHAAGARN